MKTKRLKSILALEIYKGRLNAVELRRGNGVPDVRRRLQAALSLDPFSPDPTLAGREIRNLLDEAKIGEANCVVCLPLDHILLHQVRLPEIPDADIDAFLQLEAERSFPFAPEDMVVSSSRYAAPDGTRSAMLVGMLTTQLAALEKTLRAAKLKVVSITAGAPALLNTFAGAPQALISAAGNSAELVIAGYGGLITLRTLGEFEEHTDADVPAGPASLNRELRITFGRLPVFAREQIKSIRLYAPSNKSATLARQLAMELEPFGIILNESNSMTPGEMAGHQIVNGTQLPIEFLRRHAHPLRQMIARFRARGFVWRAGAAAGALLLLTIGAFGWQHWKLRSLRNHWQQIAGEVANLQEIQGNIRTFRPWFDDTIRSLEIARRITSAFPENGDAWTRNLQITDSTHVVCTGYAVNNPEAIRLQENLRKTPGIENLRVGPLRGNKPVEFSVTCDWNPEAARGN